MPIWTFLAIEQAPIPSDALFVFGGLGLEIPARAAQLFLGGFSSTVLISGASGSLTQGVFNKAEAEVFKDAMVKDGVPRDAILTEHHATNTGQNVMFGMTTLEKADKQINSLEPIPKPF